MRAKEDVKSIVLGNGKHCWFGLLFGIWKGLHHFCLVFFCETLQGEKHTHARKSGHKNKILVFCTNNHIYIHLAKEKKTPLHLFPDFLEKQIIHSAVRILVPRTEYIQCGVSGPNCLSEAVCKSKSGHPNVVGSQ